MESLATVGRTRRTPRLLLGLGIVVAGATVAAIGALGVVGAGFTMTVAFAAAAGFSLAVLLAGAGLSLGSTGPRTPGISWERTVDGGTHLTDGGGRDFDDRVR